jgi:predicted RNA-binding Zn-ribbon protein involved in translation (DUF1610 family)
MIDLKLFCHSCRYERIIGEREFIEDLQQCPNCDSDNIEILESPTEDLTDRYLINRYLPSERELIVRASEETKMRYCKRCDAEVKPIRDPKTSGKRAWNVLAAILGAFTGNWLGFSYLYKCPNCGKVLRTRGQKNVGLICIGIYVVMAICIVWWGIFSIFRIWNQ